MHKMGLPVVHRGSPADHGQWPPLSAVSPVGASSDGQVGAWPPRLHFLSARPWNIKPGDVMPAAMSGSGKRSPTTTFPFSRCGSCPLADGQPPFILRFAWPKAAIRSRVRDPRAVKVLVDQIQPSTSLRFPLPSRSLCPTRYADRHLPRGRGNVLVYRDSLTTTCGR